MASIQEECAKRNIDCLFHFTPVDHLDSILKHGLLTPKTCSARSVAHMPNDAVRFDRQDAICLSVEWPNYKLFWNFRQRDTSRPWAIIAIQHRVLWEKRVCFNTTNAADNSMSNQTFEARRGAEKFREMFDDSSGRVRAEVRITDNLPTNPQAEVLCRDNIEPAYFMGVMFDRSDVYQRYKAAYPHVTFWHQDYYFKYRPDYEHWR